MAVVRCPKHNIPYNDLNPRGCPACAQKSTGDDRADIMAELARASRPVHGLTSDDPEESTRLSWRPEWLPSSLPFTWDKRWNRRLLKYGAPALVLLIIMITVLSGPDFEERLVPPAFQGETLPLLLTPGQPVTVMHAQLGARAPQSVADEPTLQRYVHHPDFVIDAINGVLFSISLAVLDRSWRGLRVGMPETQARGALTLLGTIAEEGLAQLIPDRRGRYLVFPSMIARPTRTLSVRVRPPNGCFDVRVVLRPRVIGVLRADRLRMAVVGRQGDSPQWVVTHIGAVSRSMVGPGSEGALC